jgi:hypothetical protein
MLVGSIVERAGAQEGSSRTSDTRSNGWLQTITVGERIGLMGPRAARFGNSPKG